MKRGEDKLLSERGDGGGGGVVRGGERSVLINSVFREMDLWSLGAVTSMV